MVTVPADEPAKRVNQAHAARTASRFPVWKKSEQSGPANDKVAKHERMIDGFHQREDARACKETALRNSEIKSRRSSTTVTPSLLDAGSRRSPSPTERQPFNLGPFRTETKDAGARSVGSPALPSPAVDFKSGRRPSIKIALPPQKTLSTAVAPHTTVFDRVRPITPAPLSQPPRAPRWEVRPILDFSSFQRPAKNLFLSHQDQKRYKQRPTTWVKPSRSGTGKSPPTGPRAARSAVDSHSRPPPASSYHPRPSLPSIPVANCESDIEIDPLSAESRSKPAPVDFAFTLSDLDELESLVASSGALVPNSVPPVAAESPSLAQDKRGKHLDVGSGPPVKRNVEDMPCIDTQTTSTESKSETPLDALPAEQGATSQDQVWIARGEEETISPPREIKLWIDDGLSPVIRWNLEDRAKFMDGVTVWSDSNSADFALLDIRPGRNEYRPQHTQLFKRSLIPVSSHWVLESAQKGKVLDVLPYLVFLTDSSFPAVNPGCETEMKVVPSVDGEEQPQAKESTPVAIKHHLDMTSSDEDDVPLARKFKKARSSKAPTSSPPPDSFDETKAKRFVSTFNKVLDKHRKWMHIAQENPQYSMSPQDWRDYMNENKSELEALGMQPATNIRRLSASGRKSSGNTLPTPSPNSDSSGSESSGSELSVSTRLEAESDFEPEAGTELGTETVGNVQPVSRRGLKAASAKHLYMLKGKFEQRQPKDKEGYEAVYQELSRITADMQVPRSARGFMHLHRRNTIPGWPWHSHTIMIGNDSKCRTESSDSSDSHSGNSSGDNTPEIQDEERQESAKEDRPAEVPQEAAEDDPHVPEVPHRPNGWLHSDDWRSDRVRILYEHLSKWDPSVMRKTAYIHSLADQHPGTKPASWYSLYHGNRGFYEERFPQLVVRRTSQTYRSTDERASNGPQSGGVEEQMMEDEVTVVLENGPQKAPANESPKETKETPAAQQSPTFNTSFVLPHTPISPFGSSLPITKEIGSFTGISSLGSDEVATPEDPKMAARTAGLKHYNIARWLTSAEEDDLERFVATRDVDVPWDDILHQWPHACSALPFTPRHVQVILQLIDFDVFENNIARRRAEAEVKGTSIEWWQPGKCVRCNGRSPDLNGNHCHDCRMALVKGPSKEAEL